MPCLPSECMINYKFIKHGSVQSYDTTITLNSLQQQRESIRELRERMGEVMHQQKKWPADSDVHWLHHPLLWQRKPMTKYWGKKKKKFCLEGKQSCLQKNALWPSVYTSPFTIHMGTSQQELFCMNLLCWESVNVTVRIYG